jgi:hypothetical protein
MPDDNDNESANKRQSQMDSVPRTPPFPGVLGKDWVFTMPGLSELTTIFHSFNSLAQLEVMPSTANLEAAYKE